MRVASATAAPPLLPPADSAPVVGVARRAEHLVEGVRAEPELRRVGLADEDAARRLHARREQAVVRGHVVAEQGRAVGGGEAGGLGDVLDRLRQAKQERALHVALARPCQDRVAGSRFGEQQVAVAPADDGVDLRVDGVDAGEKGLHDLAARERARPDRRRELVRGEIGDVAHGAVSRLSASRTSCAARSPTSPARALVARRCRDRAPRRRRAAPR